MNWVTLCSNLTRKQSNDLYLAVMKVGHIESLRQLCLNDLFFLLTVACKRKDINRDWLYDRCREVESDPDGFLDLWAREHYKSTIITFGKTIQDILRNPEITVGFFSHVRQIAKDFLNQIKRELEDNSFLQALFPDILYVDPRRESPTWSLDGGLLVKRKTNPKEKTLEAWGLVDGQPTSKHFSLLVYDDVVTLASVTTPDQIKKVTDAWALSLNLGAQGGARRTIGTRYHFNDTYRVMMERKAVKPRIYPATDNGKIDGVPVFFTKERLKAKRSDEGPYIFACHMLLDPKEDSVMGFKEEWLRYYYEIKSFAGWNFYILIDPAGEKKRVNDYTVIAVIALAPDGNYYFVDGVRDRLNLTQRTDKLFAFVRQYNPLAVGYEKYGLQADIEHIEYIMEKENYRFKIMPLGGVMAKPDRIRRLVPIFEQGRWYMPYHHHFVDVERRQRDFVNEFKQEEYLAFPVAVHDDMLDCFSLICDPKLEVRFPQKEDFYKSGSMTLPFKNINKVQTEYDLFV